MADESQFLLSSEVPAVTFSGTKPEDGHAMKMDACLALIANCPLIANSGG